MIESEYFHPYLTLRTIKFNYQKGISLRSRKIRKILILQEWDRKRILKSGEKSKKKKNTRNRRRIVRVILATKGAPSTTTFALHVRVQIAARIKAPPPPSIPLNSILVTVLRSPMVVGVDNWGSGCGISEWGVAGRQLLRYYDFLH